MTLFFRQFRAELVKLFARKRTWLGFGAFLVLEAFLTYWLQHGQRPEFFRKQFENQIGMSGLQFVFDDYFRGLTLASNIIFGTVFLLGSIFLALVAGDIVSKEAEDGTLRMTLCRPVGRVRVLAVKYLACLTYTFILVAFIGGSSLAMGWASRGLGKMFVVAPEEQLFALYDTGDGLLRYGALLFFLALSLCTITSMAFLFSCANAKPAAATVVTLAIMLMDWIFYHMPQLESLRNWFLNRYMAGCAHVVRPDIPWQHVGIDYLLLFGVDATFLIIGAGMFCRRDFKS